MVQAEFSSEIISTSESVCCVLNPAMRAVLFLLFLSLADAARAGPQMEAKLKPDPSSPSSPTDEVIQKTDEFEAIGESDETDETETDVTEKETEKM